MSQHAYALPEQGLVLDRYRPLRPLGRGGSGSVWLARDERTGLDVALKIVPRDGKRAARAAREAEAASRLRHERCVRAYDFGADSGHVYIAYEYVQGRTIRESLRAGALTDTDMIEVTAQVLDGLAHAHGRGIVHRDVKPSNVLVEDTQPVSIKLLDFGLAQFDDADTLTGMGDVPGTLAYISPERLKGGEATEASDIWAAGVMLWEGLAGEHPFWGVPLPEVAATIEAGAPPLADRRPDLPKHLVAVADAALQTRPDRRPRASELAEQLRGAWADRRPERAPKTRKPVKADAEPRVEQTPVAIEARLVPAGLAALVALVGGGLLPFWPPLLLALLAVAAGAVTLWWPRAGLALALFAPLFPLGNLSRGAALVYAAVALAWLVAMWRDARAGFAFVAGPLLAVVGGLALLPLAVQPARGEWRKGLQAAAGVLAAAFVAGLSGRALPLTGEDVPSLGLAGEEGPGSVGSALIELLSSNMALVTTALALATAAMLLPYARSRGIWGIAFLGAGQIAVVLLAAPSMPWVSVVLGTWLLCALLWGSLAVRAAR